MDKIQRFKTKGYIYQSFLETKEGASFMHGLDEAIDNGFDAVDKGGAVAVEYNESKNQIIVMDNSRNGINKNVLEGILTNARHHATDKSKNTIGIRGIGIKKFIAICGNITSGCTLDIYTSDGGSSYFKATFSIQNTDDEKCASPTLTIGENSNFTNNNFNIHDGKLRGTILILSNSSPFHFDEETYFELGLRYGDKIKLENKKLFVNHREIEPIDILHKDGMSSIDPIVVNEKDRCYLLNFNLKVYHPANPNVLFNLPIISSQCFDQDTMKKRYDFEQAPFNSYGGIYVTRGGRYINQGNNTNIMFGMPPCSLAEKTYGSTKGSGLYGDISGSMSGYNRICINVDNDVMADIFGVQAVKSKGIAPLFTNPKLFEYKTIINDTEVPLFYAISFIRRFNHILYLNYFKQAKTHFSKEEVIDSNYVLEKVKNYYDRFNFATNILTKTRENKTKLKNAFVIKKVENDVVSERHINFNDPLSIIGVNWVESVDKENKASTIKECEFFFNQSNELFDLIKDNEIEMGYIEKMMISDFFTCISHANFDNARLRLFLIAKTKFLISEYKK